MTSLLALCVNHIICGEFFFFFTLPGWAVGAPLTHMTGPGHWFRVAHCVSLSFFSSSSSLLRSQIPQFQTKIPLLHWCSCPGITPVVVSINGSSHVDWPGTKTTGWERGRDSGPFYPGQFGVTGLMVSSFWGTTLLCLYLWPYSYMFVAR